MARKAYPRRYSQAVFQIALKQQALEPWRTDLKRLAQTLTDEQLMHYWDNPRVRLDVKVSVLKDLLAGVNPFVLNLAGLLMARGRLGTIQDLVNEFERLVDTHYGIEHAEISTAIPLDEASQQRLSQELSQALGKKVTVEARVDVALVGGLVARIGDRVIDGSVKNRLENLRRTLLSS